MIRARPSDRRWCGVARTWSKKPKDIKKQILTLLREHKERGGNPEWLFGHTNEQASILHIEPVFDDFNVHVYLNNYVQKMMLTYGIAAVRGGDYRGEDLSLALVESTLDKLRRRSAFGSKKKRNFMFVENSDVENVDVAMARLRSEEAALADWDGSSSGGDE
jgi:hypothetical protein